MINSATNMEDLLASATKSGMYLVNDSNTDALVQEYDVGVIEADRLCEIIDPETNPFDSKYKARKILDDVCNKLEATRTIAQLESKRDLIVSMNKKIGDLIDLLETVVRIEFEIGQHPSSFSLERYEMTFVCWYSEAQSNICPINCHIASTRVRLGSISWECEEPHNAQIELDLAAEHYFSGFVGAVNDMVGNNSGGGDSEVQALSGEELEPPAIVIQVNDESIDAMRCLNMLGILWAGRGQVRKSLLYLLSVQKIHAAASQTKDTTITSNKVFIRELDSIYTHNLFYLAQAYGNIGNLRKSSDYCRKTLQRQLTAGLDESTKTAYDWVKNCACIADFYQSMDKQQIAALALSSAQKVLQDKVTLKSTVAGGGGGGGGGGVTEQDCIELNSEIKKKWIKLDMKMMKIAFEIETERVLALDRGEPFSPPTYENDLDDLHMYQEPGSEIPDEKQCELLSSSDVILEGAVVDQSTSSVNTVKEVCLFTGYPVKQTLYLCPGVITDFNTARNVFLRATARIEELKKIYVLDGFVTDHINLLQDHSKLYHYLAVFEEDSKRKIAMESRRVQLLLPLLTSLNRSAFDNLHKQISYELGETYLSLLDIKLEKLREKGGGGITEKNLKKSEIEKCNTYSKGILAMFAHFTNLYSSAGQRKDSVYDISNFDNVSPEVLISAGCMAPDESLLSGEEVRPFLNAHFMCCRAMSKIILDNSSSSSGSGSSSSKNKADYLVASLHRYDWLSKYSIQLCLKKSLDIDTVFGAEVKICNDMVELLPSKIDRMHFHGESGLTI